MKKFYYLFLLSIILLSSGAWAQPGTVLYYQDFDSTGNAANNYLPDGWTESDFGTGYEWLWNDNASTASQQPSPIGFNSTTASNGYIIMPSSYHSNNIGTPSSILTELESGPISITPSAKVFLEFEQYLAYCCTSSNKFKVEVSTDGANWVEYYDATLNESNNVPSSNPDTVSLDVSSTLANQTTVYLKFINNGVENYFWAIDDLRLKDGATVSLSDRNEATQKFELFPNPAHDYLKINLKAPLTENTQLRLFDISGKLQFEEAITGGKRAFELDLSQLESGVYFALLDNGENKWIEKLIVQ